MHGHTYNGTSICICFWTKGSPTEAPAPTNKIQVCLFACSFGLAQLHCSAFTGKYLSLSRAMRLCHVASAKQCKWVLSRALADPAASYQRCHGCVGTALVLLAGRQGWHCGCDGCGKCPHCDGAAPHQRLEPQLRYNVACV